MSPYVSDPNTALLRLSASDAYLLDTSYRGIFGWASPGGGKTSALGKDCAAMYLRGGFGGCVTAVKPGIPDLWARYAMDHRRAPSLILFDGETGTFNFLDYELEQRGLEGVSAVVEYLMKITEIARRASATASKHGEPAFWGDSTKMLARYTLPMIYAAYGTVTVDSIIRFIRTAPRSREQLADADWAEKSFWFQTMHKAKTDPKARLSDSHGLAIVEYWTEAFINSPPETRGNIEMTIMAALDRFQHGRLNKAFCGKTTIVPEMVFLGAIIVLAMPTLTWFEDGVLAQQLFKFAFQRAVLSRNALIPKFRDRPVFLFCDEAQETVSSYDGEFLALCRESKCSTLYMTQSLPTLIAKMGGDNARDDALGLAGKFGTHVFFNQSCPETNDFASKLIGKVLTRRGNYSRGNSESVNVGMSAGENESQGSSSNQGGSSGSSHGTGSNSNNYGSNHGWGSNKGTGTNWGTNRGRGTSENESRGYSESMDWAFEPGDFARMFKTGGKANNFEVTGLWFEAGRRFNASGTNFLLETFKQ